MIPVVAATPLVAQRSTATAPAAAAAGTTSGTAAVHHTISYDRYSLMVDGRRVILQAGEFEYWRLPSPSLWLDVMEKMKARGLHPGSGYLQLALHSPNPRAYGFPVAPQPDHLQRLAQHTRPAAIATAS